MNKVNNYILAMFRKCDGYVFMVTPNKKFSSYDEALDKAKELASIRSDDYEYIVLKLVASAKLARKPVEVTEY